MAEDSESIDYRGKLKSLRENARSRRDQKTIRLVQEAFRRNDSSKTIQPPTSSDPGQSTENSNLEASVNQNVPEEIRRDIETHPERAMALALERVNEMYRNEGKSADSADVFARRINEQIGRYLPDDFDIKDLVLTWGHNKHLPYLGTSSIIGFYKRTIFAISRPGAQKSLGDLRHAPDRELFNSRNLGEKGLRFLKTAFEPIPPREAPEKQ